MNLIGFSYGWDLSPKSFDPLREAFRWRLEKAEGHFQFDGPEELLSPRKRRHRRPTCSWIGLSPLYNGPKKVWRNLFREIASRRRIGLGR